MTRINEFHYDNAGGDVGEFIEIRTALGTDMTGVTVELYNGNNSAVYNTLTVSSGTKTSDASFDYYVLDLPANGIQNGSPDGIALSDTSGLIEFLSYEGSFTAIGGAADGQTSTDIGQEESGSTPVGHSLQRNDDGSWRTPETETKGVQNATTSTPTDPVFSITTTTPSVTEGDSSFQALTFTVTRSGDTTQADTVEIVYGATGSTVDSNDTVDPVPFTATLAFAPGEATSTPSFGITGDTDVEPDEDLVVTLQNPSRGTIGTASVTVTVLDDDTPPTPTTDARINEFHYDNAGARHGRVHRDPRGKRRRRLDDEHRSLQRQWRNRLQHRVRQRRHQNKRRGL